MPCFHPIPAYQCSDGGIVFCERKGDVVRSLELPCGQCVGCRLARARSWALRCMHEAQMYEENSFITLTYAPEHLPERGQLQYSDFQLFFKRFRRRVSPIKPRFYMCGEYGDRDGRPHFHACIFGFSFREDRKLWKKTGAGSLIYRSALLEALWPFGHSSVGDLTLQSAGYVARYCMKKVNGARAAEHYLRVDPDTGELYSMVPEFTHMSLKPGIGASWLSTFLSDVFPHDFCVVDGKMVRVPKYYDRRLEELDPILLEGLKFDREVKAAAFAFDNTPERLVVKEVVAEAALSRLRRSI